MGNDKGPIRQFETGATRDTEEGKLDYEGFLHPLVVERFAEHMQKHRTQPDGEVRESDNWQKGIPKDVYMKSLWRHFHTAWKAHRGYTTTETVEEALCAMLFNVQGYLLEELKEDSKEQPLDLASVVKGSDWRLIKVADRKEYPDFTINENSIQITQQETPQSPLSKFFKHLL